MHPAVDVLLKVLSQGGEGEPEAAEEQAGVVGGLARVYEQARSAMEYRAEHLVRRAAVERILKRQMLFNQNPDFLARQLLTELRWARYVTPSEIEHVEKGDVSLIIGKYLTALAEAGDRLPYDWVVGVLSAEIEERLNLNIDYGHFTHFAFQVIKQKLEVVENEKNWDLLVFIATDKAYGQSDDQQVGYHIVKLLDSDWGRLGRSETLLEARELYVYGINHPLTVKLAKYVRSQSAPLILLRDVYFAAPEKFRELMADREAFEKRAKSVLSTQLLHMSGRVNRATARSVIYVFLTKMLFGMLVEVPMDLLLVGEIATTPLLINLLFPPSLMWLVSMGSWLPGIVEQKALVHETWRVVGEFETLGEEKLWLGGQSRRAKGLLYGVFSAMYIVVFLAVFAAIFYLLQLLKFSLASQIVFVFFLSIVAFFAYRIRQTSLIYNWSPKEGGGQSLGDMIALPLLAVGSKLSLGISKLNFLVFIFDFILEAPFKTILRFLDSWVQFLSVKRDEVVGN
ncbi:hypothetical protein A2634_05275 [Candidatus Amesbacteria bacterium RIFCSPHIGHO2_01_FULL_48_32]|uniref:Uncharacterized protein n=1 Tax=Candidatus Amesbacteria bacterium RIFCSPLOWO2_01_FULL_48_25 TaxID=1797259 RepID=A0A1F4ZD21_9BACT|nr:MAG: hypothetical protein A2634_05275 [Candidatus Amesbacteria bacterium RIFCSPHIGHO2_01_FULL_48_32]OGD04078.1 MAG: hypothetical protein A2989_01620 [Candidatus Amesbacteria bacterium RIFCSPLOWO2_01_FULL_48_25]HJZ05656.1 hypothetical protein [Patescibacteria group bacterium]